MKGPIKHAWWRAQTIKSVFETDTYVKFEMNLKENFDHVTTPF